MSLKHLKVLVETARDAARHHPLKNEALAVITAAMAEILALEKAAKDLTRLHLMDVTDDVAHRDHVVAAMTGDPASQWNHPNVVAWGEAAKLLATIAKEAA